ncbi:MAG TPA: SAVED domain-containing protein [Thermoanaerobaculia bacterium]|nr:SAVED domain-containing protein [Thermoanaerobaculia bacterium]
MLWGQAGGRCEFSGHNVNLAQKAHIYAFSEGGPRSDSGIGDDEINDLSNLILVCHECHQKIGATRSGGRYTAPLLRQWKREHEERIERVTGVAPEKTSHILLYGANIGGHTALLDFQSAAVAMFPDRYPADGHPIELSTIHSSLLDRDGAFWGVEGASLRRKFQQSVGARLATRDIQHLSVFALAPQPLLILLGTLLGDLVPADIYQRHREPPGWNWPANAARPWFEVHEPENRSGPAALVLALSATVTPDRIHAVLGADASVWTVTVREPHNDMMQSREQLSELRTILRTLLDRIKAVQGQSSPLHIFPAAPVSAAIELGRVRMPKADMPWHLYDQVNALGGFTPALTIAEAAHGD